VITTGRMELGQGYNAYKGTINTECTKNAKKRIQVTTPTKEQ